MRLQSLNQQQSPCYCPMNREDALRLVEKTSRLEHSLLVSRVMVSLSEAHGESCADWEVAGLLHDLDYDVTRNDRRLHGLKAAESLEGLLPEHVLQAIKAHDHRTGIEPDSPLDHGLRFADAVSVLIEDGNVDGKPWIREIIDGYSMPIGLNLAALIKSVT